MNGDYFEKKDEAILALKNSDDLTLKIFAEDIVEEKAYKQYYLYNYNTIYKRIIRSKMSNFYEYILSDEKVKLMFDIDCKSDVSSFNLSFDEIIDGILDKVKEELLLYTNIKPNIIILSATTDIKKSSHVIFNNIYFNNVIEMKNFVLKINEKNKENQLFKDKLIDMSIYREGCFRLLHCSKKGQTNRFKYYKSENYSYKNDLKLFLDTLITNCSTNQNSSYLINIEINNTKKQIVTKINKTIDIPQIEYNEIKQNVINLCYLLNKDRFKDYEEWYNTGCLLKNLDISFDVFNELSSQLPKYKGYEDTLYRWNKFPIKDKYNFGYLYYYAKEDSPKEYDELFSNYYDSDNIEIESDIEKINISQRRLLDLSTNSLLTDNTDVLTNGIKKWYENKNNKVMTIKSPYDTGKTTLIQTLLDVYNPKRVLFISYRRTLTYDIYGIFETKYNFSSYMDKKYIEDRLIVQVESIGNLINAYNIGFEEEIIIPKYDLVIIDECESVLNQFNSTKTFKKLNSREVFDFMDSIIVNSSKVLFLDGDMDMRSYDFANSFNLSTESKSTHIVNMIKINKKKLNITKRKQLFINKMMLDISNGLNIGIVSMSATEAAQFYDLFKNKYPEKKILLYTGDTSDKDKENLKNVLEAWSDVNILIYSPTIEAGVSYDKEHFHKLYGIISDFSTSQRAYKQMLSRIRKINCNEVLIYNKDFTYNKNVSFWKFKEVKRSLISLDTIKLNKQKIISPDGQVSYKLSLNKYDINYVHNKVEELNKNPHYFIAYLKHICELSGYEVNFIDDNPDNIEDMMDEMFNEDDVKDINILLKYENICNAPNIDHNKYEELLKKQINSCATQDEKYMIKKYLYLKLFGVNKLNHSILKKLNKTSIDNYLGLIDVKNITHYIDTKKEYNIPVDDISDNKIYIENINNILTEKIDTELNHKNIKLIKLNFIKSIINGLGFKHIFDQKYIHSDIFEEKIDTIIETNPFFQNFKDLKVLFNLSKIKKRDDFKDSKSFIRFINPILENYNISISTFKKEISKNKKIRFYYIERINNIDEIIHYKTINKKYILIDSNSIFHFSNNLTYSDMSKVYSEKFFENKTKYNDLL